jgi:transcriptional regulator with XRE-family HTH domain
MGRIQLLGALIAFTYTQGRNRIANTDAANRIGRALSGLRSELGLTQDELAYRGGFSRIALSQWERGRWPPSMGPIYQWCAALGLVAEEDEPQVSFLDVTPQLIMLLRDDAIGSVGSRRRSLVAQSCILPPWLPNVPRTTSWMRRGGTRRATVAERRAIRILIQR